MSELRLGQDLKYLQRKADDQNLKVVLPLSNEVFLDIDSPYGDFNKKVMEYLATSMYMSVVSSLITTSKNGNKHYYIRMNKALTDLERTILAVCLGSDPVKELFSFIQMHHIDGFDSLVCECPIALFETQLEYKRVLKWRDTLPVNAAPDDGETF